MLHTYNTQERARLDKNNKATKKKNKINSERSERPGLYTYTTSGKLQCDFFFYSLCDVFRGQERIRRACNDFGIFRAPTGHLLYVTHCEIRLEKPILASQRTREELAAWFTYNRNCTETQRWWCSIKTRTTFQFSSAMFCENCQANFIGERAKSSI